MALLFTNMIHNCGHCCESSEMIKIKLMVLPKYPSNCLHNIAYLPIDLNHALLFLLTELAL